MIGTSWLFPPYDSVHAFLSFFDQNTTDLRHVFDMDSDHEADALYGFIMAQSDPRGETQIPLVQTAMLLLLSHPLIASAARPGRAAVPLRTLLVQVIGRCIRRAARFGIRTLEHTVPRLLPHFRDQTLLQDIVAGLQNDLRLRLVKTHTSPRHDAIYHDVITANLLVVFDHVYMVNEAFDVLEHGGRIDPRLFYSPDLSRYIDVREDYVHWRSLEDARRSAGGAGGVVNAVGAGSANSMDASHAQSTTLPALPAQFAFCEFTWILGLREKGELLVGTNGIRMRHQLQDAFFRAVFDGVQSPHLVLSVRRSHVLSDALAQLDQCSPHNLAKQLKIQFVGEEGVDEGGLRKEFFQLCWQELFKAEYDIFHELSDRGLFWFAPLHQTRAELDDSRVAGLLLGLAVYNGVLVEPRFPLFLYKRLLGWPITLGDYAELDAQLVRSIIHLRRLPREQVSDLALCFAVDQTELVPNGLNIPVTAANLDDYLSRLEEHHLRDSYAPQYEAFRGGFEAVCAGSVLYGFRPEELYSLTYGSDHFAVSELRAIAVYDGGFAPDSPQISWLWSVLTDDLSPAQHRAFLHFVTGSARAPAGGLAQLGSFTITRVGGSCNRLPAAHTCFNTLLLCEYPTRAVLLERLLLALEHNQGFGLI